MYGPATDAPQYGVEFSEAFGYAAEVRREG
jgi:hypothetical protein